MSQTVNAGIVTAYGAAVRGGYQGTYNEFCEDLVKLTKIINDLTDFEVTVETLAEGASATGTYSDGILSLGIPRGATGNGISRITLNADYTLTVYFTSGAQWTSDSIRGAKGETGATPNLTIGTVTTLPAGQDATAEIGGTAEEPVLNIGIPKGQDGDVSASSIAQNYDPDATYEVGDYRWQAGQLYRCTVAIDTPEAWNSEHWTAVQLADEVGDVKDALTAVEDTISDPTHGLDGKAPVIVETASGAIASFEDGADGMPIRKLVVNVEPVQDLHGYDSPWPAGGGKNLIPNLKVQDTSVRVRLGESTVGDGFFLKAGTYCISYRLSASQTVGVYWRTVKDGDVGPVVNNNLITLSEDSNVRVWLYTSDGISADNVSWFQVELGSTATAYAPYSNECPITGWTGAEIEQTGKNLFDPNVITYGGRMSLVTDPSLPYYGYYNGYVRRWTNEFSGSTMCQTNGIVTVSANVMATQGTFTFRIDFYYDDGTIGQSSNFTATTTPSRFSRTSNQNKNCVGITISTIAGIANEYGCIKDIQVELSSSESDFVPYTGNQISVTFPDEAGTVYGAKITINPDRTGEMVVDRAIVDLGTLLWEFGTDFSATSSLQRSIKPIANNTTKADMVCSCYEVKALWNDGFAAGNAMIAQVSGNQTVRIRDDRITDASSIPTLLSGQKLVYTLATPQSFQLTAEQVSGVLETLYGTNNIFASTGNVEVEFCADTRLFIEQLTKPTEDDMTADHAISAGTFFMIGNTLYLATSQIAAGATITPGTNATKLSLADALNTLNT